MTLAHHGAATSGAVRRGAILGFGNVAANGHVPGWLERADARIVAVADVDPERLAQARRLLPAARVYATADELLRQEPLDFVDIAAPPSLHAPMIVAAAAAGVHVLCEKPLTTSAVEYAAVRAAAARAGTVVYTVHNWKFSEAFQAAQRLLNQGAIGTLSGIRFETARNGCSVATGANWRIQAGVAGGGILVDHGWHQFYLLLGLVNQRPQCIRAVVDRRRYLDSEVEDSVACTVEFPSVTATLDLTWAAMQRRTRWEFRGTRGELVIDDDHLQVRGERVPAAWILGTALSAGSHHPDWFAGVVDGFLEEIEDQTVRGANQAEAELCLLMLTHAYASGAQGGRPLAIPAVDAVADRSAEQV